ncbi:hypothetical protein [Caulobacter sp. NIBR2454]|uniref:hypothetical protein n=1 Tax=Caulobacter sp. NIBR2454 TaxID=3015996 RepID=UPI0022B65A12|nr:hypothetical protein [Caulobacter sp. NIBR2454]
MAKAVFQKNQKVWVESVGCWSTIERIVPTWARGFDEPVRITYDVGLGREFHAHELKAEDRGSAAANLGANWRLLRARNKWQSADDCAHHPYPGTYPVVVTDPSDWGGWRVPGAEYDRDPVKLEKQARLIASAPKLQAIARDLIAMVAEDPADAPPAVAELAAKAAIIERYVQEVPAVAKAADEDVEAA